MKIKRTTSSAGSSLPKSIDKKQPTKILITEGKVVADHINHSIHSKVGLIQSSLHTPEPKAIISDWQKFWRGVNKGIGKLAYFIRVKAKAKISAAIFGLILILTFSSSISAQGVVPSSKYGSPVTASASLSEIKAEVTAGEAPLFQWPLNGEASQEFGYFHPGIDIPNPVGSAIKPVASGTVEKAARDGDGRGLNVTIKHKGGFSSNYFHLEKILVSVGDEVEENTTIGLVGLTGHTTGAHLHFELLENEKPVNPRNFLP
ncbi:MAG: M23 family metallopeptidase [Patescibacteria group bacterium]|nr:M23 family metallopeptidase [Patescibacteria group bacterium]